MKKSTGIILMAIASFLACKKSGTLNSSGDPVSPEVKPAFIQNGLLHISDFNQLDTLSKQVGIKPNSVNRNTTKSLLNVCGTTGGSQNSTDAFISMQDCYDMITADELRVAQQEEANDSNTEMPEHSSLVETYPGIVQAKYLKDGTGYYDVNLNDCDMNLMPYLNKDRMIVVGDQLYQFGEDTVKTIAYQNETSVRDLKHNNVGVLFLNVKEKNTISTQGLGAFNLEKEESNGSKVTIVRIALPRTPLTHYNIASGGRYLGQRNVTYGYEEPLHLTVRSLKKRLFGLWMDNYNTNFSNITITVNYPPTKVYDGTLFYNPWDASWGELWNYVDHVTIKPAPGLLTGVSGKGTITFPGFYGNTGNYDIFEYYTNSFPSRIYWFNSSMRYGVNEPLQIDYVNASVTANGKSPIVIFQ